MNNDYIKNTVHREPRIHSHITDCLPECHKLAREDIFCDNKQCNAMVHCFNNECMNPWVETGIGNFCFECFIEMRILALDGVHLLEIASIKKK